MKLLIRIFFFCLIFYFTGFSQANYYLKDGDFEDERNHWILRGTCEITTQNAHTGVKALKILPGLKPENFAYIYTEQPVDEFDFTFWFYPQDSVYQTKIDLVANWDKSGADYISSLIINNNFLRFTSLKQKKTINHKIDFAHWNKISVKTDSLGYVKKLFINDSLFCSLITADNLPVEAIVLGGLKSNECFGTVLFDDVSIDNMNKKTIFYSNTIYWIQAGFASSFSGLGLNLQVGYISGPHLFLMRYLNAGETRFVLFAADPVTFDSPRESIQEIAFLYGRYYRNNVAVTSIAAGIGYVDAGKRGQVISSDVYIRNEIVKICLPVELAFKVIMSQKLAISMSAYAILNNQQSFYGATVGIQFGNLY